MESEQIKEQAEKKPGTSKFTSYTLESLDQYQWSVNSERSILVINYKR